MEITLFLLLSATLLLLVCIYLFSAQIKMYNMKIAWLREEHAKRIEDLEIMIEEVYVLQTCFEDTKKIR